MTESVSTLNFLLSTGGALLLAASMAMFFDIAFNQRRYFGGIIDRYGLLLAAGLTVSAMVMALFYSEVLGFLPCSLCWSMRIFVFSQAFIMTVAWWRNDTPIALYGMILAIPGILIGLYQHTLQMGWLELLPCPAGEGDCAKRIMFEYGFMTFPLLGVSMLLFVLAIYIYLYRAKRPDGTKSA